MTPPEKIRRIQSCLEQVSEEMHRRGPVDYSELRKNAPTWPVLALRVCETELEVELLVDSACREISATKCAPLLLTPRVQYFLQVRIHAASWLLDELFPADSADSAFQDFRPDWTDGQILSWLLIDQWRRRRALWLKLTSLAQYGPFEFESYQLWRRDA